MSSRCQTKRISKAIVCFDKNVDILVFNGDLFQIIENFNGDYFYNVSFLKISF